ncbi:hypothetical protein [Isaria javanica chrysovirus 1]|uniref:Uncharacterized protein n=1 Tax=Isaria javanica chrysovirus 1 TaxID=1930960 RepID=A0A1L6KVX1_9VIRU|nr:hypothetical protein [Isaria javanica chrysovirus 1]APR73430.1 hypothetical protein [Isaria javanica chrysovirus 1]
MSHLSYEERTFEGPPSDRRGRRDTYSRRHRRAEGKAREIDVNGNMPPPLYTPRSNSGEYDGELDGLSIKIDDAIDDFDVAVDGVVNRQARSAGKHRRRGTYREDVSEKQGLARLLDKLRLDRHKTSKRPGTSEPKSRKDYHRAMEKLREPSRQKDKDGKEDFWADQERARAKVADAISRMKRLHGAEMPKHTIPVPSEDEVRSDFVGIVMPMGHGKTTLAREEGWVDFDSLISPKKRNELLDEVYERIAGGASIGCALSVLLPEAKKTLALLRPKERWVLVAQDACLLAGLNVECAGGIVMDERVVLEACQGRQEFEEILIRKNMAEVAEQQAGAGTLLTSESYEETRMLAYRICIAFGITVSRPSDFGLTDPLMSQGPGLTSTKMDLEDMVTYYDKGKVPRESVDYQVHLSGLQSYKGFGFTSNKWAKFLSKVTETIGDVSFVDADWNPRVMSLDTFGSHSDLSGHDDVQYILSAQKGEHERFVLGLLLHWKGIGMHCGLGNRLLPFYGVRRCHWKSVMANLRECVASSGTFMGLNLTMEERKHIMSLGLLVGGSLNELKGQMFGMKVSYPRIAPGLAVENKVIKQLDQVGFKFEVGRAECLVLEKLLGQSSLSTISHLVWAVGDQPSAMPLNEAIAISLGLELCRRWGDNDSALERIPGITHKLITKWYKVCVLRDEWSDFINRIMAAEVRNFGLAQAIAKICSCDPQAGTSGLEWGVRVCEALKGFIVCSIVTLPGKLIGVVEDRATGQCRPCVGGIEEGDLWKAIIQSNIPRHALGVFGGTVSALSLANELCEWQDSPTVAILEMVNCHSWEPRIGPGRMATCIYRWGRVCSGKVSDAVSSFMLNSHSYSRFGHSYARIASRLEFYARLSSRCGGLGCHQTHIDSGSVEKIGPRGEWIGTGKIHTLKEEKRADTTTLAEKISQFQDQGLQYGTPKDIRLAINLCGMVVCSLLQDQGKSALNINATLLTALASR